MSLSHRPNLPPQRALALCLALFAVPALADSAPHAFIEPAQSLALLKDGNKRFVKGASRHADTNASVRKLLASGQKPHAIVLSCSDSRVPPELVFDQGLGKLFVVRVAGNVVNPTNLASIEYAVEHLGARLLVVLGHESCGAVHAALSTPAGTSAGSPSLDGLVGAIRHNLAAVKFDATLLEDKKLSLPVRTNVEAVTAQLAEASPVLRERLEKKELVIVPAIYALATGEVSFWGDDGLAHTKH